MQMQMFASVPEVLRDFEKQFPKAVAVALTRTGWEVRKQLMTGMQQSFDRPTPFTMRAFRVDMAKASTLEATVWALPMQAKYLANEIEGGKRDTKAFERKMHLFGGQVALPSGGAKLNGYGNMSMSFIKSVNADENSGGSAKRFFTGTPRGWLGDGRFDGVWARVDDNHRLVRVMSFANEAKYEGRLQMSVIAQRTVDSVFESQLIKAMRDIASK